MIYNFYIFDRAGQCLVFHSWNQAMLTQKAINNRCKLIFGLLYTLKAFTNKITPHEVGELEKENFHTMTTPEYKLHYFETLSNLRFVLTTDVNSPPLTELLKHIYNLFATHVVRLGLCSLLSCSSFLCHLFSMVLSHTSILRFALRTTHPVSLLRTQQRSMKSYSKLSSHISTECVCGS